MAMSSRPQSPGPPFRCRHGPHQGHGIAGRSVRCRNLNASLPPASAAVQTVKLTFRGQREPESSLPCDRASRRHRRPMLDVVLHPMLAAAETASGPADTSHRDHRDLDRAAIRSFLHSVMPALDGAFGLDRCETFPHEVAGLIVASSTRFPRSGAGAAKSGLEGGECASAASVPAAGMRLRADDASALPGRSRRGQVPQVLAPQVSASGLGASAPFDHPRCIVLQIEGTLQQAEHLIPGERFGHIPRAGHRSARGVGEDVRGSVVPSREVLQAVPRDGYSV